MAPLRFYYADNLCDGFTKPLPKIKLKNGGAKLMFDLQNSQFNPQGGVTEIDKNLNPNLDSRFDFLILI